jgi:hypothetical protein
MKAFPNHRSEGMDLRDYFAAVALSSICELEPPISAARAAYEYADAMIKERENNEQRTT